ncbi:MAG: c-type cytochrome [Candidatus Pedobacter colombiensis]|uniref:C-type cytochrome n=1 Tax=Candidatus Pedobacter colombiensis TaxID=3121371 RepID=A0AAJ5W4H6_9SPHI|nr:c-type cytochrome [Pedobacter sp.]WEK17812.1 MAG: c-type cytochrome [Pedobacter sp.]
MKRNKKLVWSILVLSMVIYTCKVSRQIVQRDANGNIIVNKNPSPAYLSPQESLKTMHLQKGYHLELVASEPMIHEPVAIAWDGNGRMYVAEMNTYMQDADGTGEMKPICTVKRLEDTNGDGKMDKAVVFIDQLLLPRMILALDDRILVNETNSNNIYSYRDTDGDGKADEKKLVFRNDEISTSNLEHQKSGLMWNLDNRIYVTVENKRYVYQDGMLKAESLYEGPGGQWGLTSDNYGRLFFSAAGSETPALNFQQNPAYGRFDFKDQYNDDFQAVWPIISTPDVQGGLSRLRPDSTLNHFTACTGQSIFRGTALPADAQGDLFICEPVGRLIRRAKVTNTNGKITLKNAYNKEEFIASTDMNFRPVNSVTGPDGCLYIVDMYRGIIQEGNWTKKGTYLRKQIDEKKFDKNIGRGRIYRVVYDGIKPDRNVPKMLDLSTDKLIPYLAHANGWWRDNAQKLIVIRGDKSVVPALKVMALSKTTSQLGKIHALWTLSGLKVLDKELLKQAFRDNDPELRKTAVWICDDLVGKGAEQLINEMEFLKNDPNADVRFQLALTLRFSKSDKAQDIIKYMIANYPDNQLLVESQKSFENENNARVLAARKAAAMKEEDQKLMLNGATIFKQLCAICHGADGKGVTIGGKDMPAPPLAGVKDVNGDPEKLIKILLHGLSGPVDDKKYADAMPALGSNDDEYIASVLSYIRNDLGNKAPLIKPEEVRKVRAANQGRTKNWTIKELESTKK